MGSGFLNYRPSPEEVPISPLWLRPTAALGRIPRPFRQGAGIPFPLPSDQPHHADRHGTILTMGSIIPEDRGDQGATLAGSPSLPVRSMVGRAARDEAGRLPMRNASHQGRPKK
jgi:hypothetical protein